MINITIPVLNEEEILEKNINEIYDFLKQNIFEPWFMVIVNNGSTDQTEKIAQKLAKTKPGIRYLYLDKRGKGLAIRTSWEKFPADICSFMDADLSTDLSDFPNLILPLHQNFDLCIGSRRDPKSKVKKPFFRKLISFGYALILKLFFNTSIKDAPCGFKAFNKNVLDSILNQVKDNAWFFDSELILLAENKNFKIKQIPITWHETERQSHVNIFNTSKEYLRKLWELKKRFKK